LDFEWSDAHNDFRRRVRRVIEDQLPTDWAEKSRFDTGSKYVSEFSRRFCPVLAEHELLIPHWPKAVGGGGLDPFHHWILGEEMFAVGEPRSYQYMNVNWAGPAILRYGTPEQKEFYITPIAQGVKIWCQGFSEPGAGSDLAALKTRAVATDRGYVINGSKIWTSGASLADYCFLLARTGEGKRDISVFLVPMDSPGVEARVIPNLNGERSLHEVFLTDVEVPHFALLGGENQGWPIILSVIHDERVGLPRYVLPMLGLDRAVQYLSAKRRFDARAQMRAAQARAACEAARNLCLEVVTERAKGRPPTAKTYVARYAIVAADRLTSDFMSDFLMEEVIENVDPLIVVTYKRAASSGVAAGSSEMQLNNIARDLLHLPREG